MTKSQAIKWLLSKTFKMKYDKDTDVLTIDVRDGDTFYGILVSGFNFPDTPSFTESIQALKDMEKDAVSVVSCTCTCSDCAALEKSILATNGGWEERPQVFTDRYGTPIAATNSAPGSW